MHKPMTALIDAHYQSRKHDFCDKVFDHLRMMTQAPHTALTGTVMAWLENHQRTDPDFFTMHQCECLQIAARKFREEHEAELVEENNEENDE